VPGRWRQGQSYKMKRIYPLIFLLLCKSHLYSQNDPVSIFNSHVFPCDSGSTTLEVNFCSGDKFDFVDSLLNGVYKRIIKAIDKDIHDDKRRIIEISSKKDTGSNDKESIRFLKDEIAHNDRP
jgi:hypothetical protein